MDADDYIQPIDFKLLLRSAEKIQDALLNDQTHSNIISSISCTFEALYNIIQECQENEDMDLLIIDCRNQDEFEDEHISQAVNISSDGHDLAVICSSFCHLSVDSHQQHFFCLYGESKVQIDRVISLIQRLNISINLLTVIALFSDIKRQFPFLLSNYPVQLHGVLPLSLMDSTFFLSSTAVDPSVLQTLSIASLLSLTEDLTEFTQTHPTPLLLQCECVYDRLPQILLLLLVHTLHPSLSLEECIIRLKSSWKSYSITLASLESNHIDTSIIDVGLRRSICNLVKIQSKLIQFCEIHQFSSILLTLSVCDVEAVIESWPIDHLFPLIDLIACSIRNYTVTDIDLITGSHSLFASVFSIPYSSSPTMAAVLLQLMCECVSEGMQGVLALPLLIRHSVSIQQTLQNAMQSSRKNTKNAALLALCATIHFCGLWIQSNSSNCSQLLTSTFAAEIDMYELMNQLVQDWCGLADMYIRREMESELHLTEIELLGSSISGMDEQLVIAFFADNDCSYQRMGDLYLQLVKDYSLYIVEGKVRYECDGCFVWLRERALIKLVQNMD